MRVLTSGLYLLRTHLQDSCVRNYLDFLLAEQVAALPFLT